MASVVTAMAERTLREPPQEFIEWVRANAIPLAGSDPGLSARDLEPLRGLIGDARVLTLGEATHGTREFFQLKRRLLEFCVREMNFTMFGLEAGYADMLSINDYVRGDDDDDVFPLLALTSVWAWDCEEFVDLIRWLRAYNQRPGASQKFSFWGWDPSWPASAARRVIDYIDRNHPLLAELTQRLAPLATDFTASVYKFLPWPVQNATADAIVEVARALDSAPFEIRHPVRVLEQGERQLRCLTVNERFAMRSGSAAETIGRLLDTAGPESRMVAWAHNGHFQRTSFVPGVEPIGARLSTAFGSRHVTLGFAFNEGQFRAIDLASGEIRAFTLPPSPAGTLDAALATFDAPMFALDLRAAPRSGPAHEWLASGPPMRVMTSTWTDDEELVSTVWGPLDKPNSLSWADPRDCFDLLIFVRSTTASRGNHPDWPNGFVSLAEEVLPSPGNLGFVAGPDGHPTGWLVQSGAGPAAYRVEVADGALMMSRSGTPPYWGGDARVSRAFSAEPYRERRVRFSVRIEDGFAGAGRGEAYLRVNGPGPAVPSQYSVQFPLALALGSRSLEADVPPVAESITIGLVGSGNGRAVFRNPSFEVLGQ
jgi:erythromycin esterase